MTGVSNIPSFSDLGVSAPLVARLAGLGITEPLPIQCATIADALAGRDICGGAPTGSGKTLAFGLPLLQRTPPGSPRRPRALVLVPTRELAAQVQDALNSLGLGPKSGRNRVVAVYGGTGYGIQCRELHRGVDIVVACPGRLEDLVTRGDINLGDVETIVVDEADRMADMGFLPAVRRILDLTAADRQVLLFSATMGTEVEAIVRMYQHEPVRHNIVADEETSGDVAHHFWFAERAERVGLTARLVTQHGRAVVFCRTKHGADRVARQLKAAGVDAAAIHGDRSQGQREKALASFSNGKVAALVATDVVARGIHVDGLPCVVHFDPAADPTDYVHRSGRTGRVGGTGTVVSLVTEEHRKAVQSLQRVLGMDYGLQRPFDPIPTSFPQASPPIPANGLSPKQSNNKRKKRKIMPTGTVKFFNGEKGYGFISRPDGNDVFVHYSNVEGSGYRTLEEGQQVEFEVAPGRKGEEARNVKVI